jgi:hypothetical protein
MKEKARSKMVHFHSYRLTHFGNQGGTRGFCIWTKCFRYDQEDGGSVYYTIWCVTPGRSKCCAHTRTEHGNKKKAMASLRATTTSKSHHFSTFRSGLLLGLALPALVSGLYQCTRVVFFETEPTNVNSVLFFAAFQENTRASIPGWDTLLFVYGVLLIPVLFSLLVGLNVLVWSESRINYVFIFGEHRLYLHY